MLKIDSFRHALSHKVHACQISAESRHYVYQNRENKKNINCINLQLVIRISQNRSSQTCITPPPIFVSNLRPIGLLVIVQPCSKVFFYERRTDGRHDRRTDGQTGSFFRKEKNY